MAITMNCNERTNLIDSLRCYWSINRAIERGMLAELDIEWLQPNEEAI